MALAGVLVAGTVMGTTVAAAMTAAAAPPAMVPVAQSDLGPPAATDLGAYEASALGVEVVLTPAHGAAMEQELAALYDPSSPSFHRWLAAGAFLARYAPSPADRSAVADYLAGAGLELQPSPSPFLVRAVGTSARVTAAFATSIDRYRAPSGQTFFAAAAPVGVPARLAGAVAGVIGLSDTVEEQPLDIGAASIDPGAHYGAGPFGSGLTPSQLDGIYDANAAVAAGPRGQGRGVTMGVFELSGYTASDINTYVRQFFGRRAGPSLVNVDVDGGPLTPRCPAGDSCHHRNDYSGDIEVEADLETQIAVAPRASRILVYDAPNDRSGETTVDE
ncbi:MAG: protease pro-enzyme activation domain-containing protein, partial [Acidimicrobiales bacterium]